MAIRNARALFLLALVSASLFSCGKGGDGAPPPALGGTSQPELPPDPDKPPPPGPAPTLPTFHAASLWRRVPGSLPWTRVVLDVVRGRIHDLERAADVSLFCPGYATATRAQREVCWLRLVGGIVEFESSFRPTEPPFHEGGGVYSVGLMALSKGECPNAPTDRHLLDPLLNLHCGVNKMATLIARYGYVDGPNFKGACAYWSTLRAPYRKWDPVRQRWLNLGKKNQIMERTKTYRGFL